MSDESYRTIEIARELERSLYRSLPCEERHVELPADELRRAIFRLVTNCPPYIEPFVYYDEGRAHSWMHYGREKAAMAPSDVHSEIAAATLFKDNDAVLSTIEVLNIMRYLSKQAALPTVAPLMRLRDALGTFTASLPNSRIIPDCLISQPKVRVSDFHRLLDRAIVADAERFPLSQGSTANLVGILERLYCNVICLL